VSSSFHVWCEAFLSFFVICHSLIISVIPDLIYPFCRYRMLSRPYAFGCIFKLRTSVEFKPSRAVSVNHELLWELFHDEYNVSFCLLVWAQYGHFFPDPQYENVQHIICCDSHATYAYDFEFSNLSGFDG
jgi:hypothetical protein